MRLAVALAVAFSLGACGRDQRTPKAPAADCALVAESLTSFELGNYAPIEERAPKVAAWKARCEAEQLTQPEGQCVIDAQTVGELRECPRSLMFVPYVATQEGDPLPGLPVVCSAYLLTLEKYARCGGLPEEARRAIHANVKQMRRNWTGLSGAMPPAVTEACIQGNAAIVQAMATFNCP